MSHRLFVFLTGLLALLTVTEFSSAGQPPYPIIFVHGLSGSDETFATTLRYLGGQDSEFDWGFEINVYDMLLNRDDNVETSILANDVAWSSFPFGEGTIELGRRYWPVSLGANEPGEYSHSWGNSSLFAINFQEERIEGAHGLLNDHFDYSNSSAIYKQGYALGQMIEEVLTFTGAEKVILVGHSMGGLAIREYLQRTEDGSHRWWVDPGDAEYGHKVAKVVTIGTPHLGSNFWNVTRETFPGSPWSEGMRDLRYAYNRQSGWAPDSLLDDGVYLFGGSEHYIEQMDDEWFDGDYFNYNTNCDGDAIDWITGINSDFRNGMDNPAMPLPTNVEYAWITSDFMGSGGDGVVRLDRQYLYNVGDTLLTNRFHSPGEGSDYTSILRGLDEPDEHDLAYDLELNAEYDFLTTYQSDFYTEDDDWFRFTVTGAGTCHASFSDLQNSAMAMIGIYDDSDQPVAPVVSSPDESVTINFATSAGQNTYWIHYLGQATSTSWEHPNHMIITHSLSPMSLTLQSPNGGNWLVAGENETISWQSQNLSGLMSISMNRDYPTGAWETLAASVPVSSGQWTWNPITGPASSHARIRIIRSSPPAVGDTSDADFTIVEPPAEVTNLVIQLSPNGQDVVLDWSPATGAGSYNVYAGDSPSFAEVPSALISTTVDTAFVVIDGLTSEEMQFYTVCSNNSWSEIPEGMVYVPAAQYSMGAAYQSWAQPIHPVNVPAFCIDIYEVTNAQYRAFCVAMGHPVPPDPGFPNMPDYFNNPVYANYPVVELDWFDAKAYCEWRGAGYRLPTEAEWERAAKGCVDNRQWPWGDTWVAANANVGGGNTDGYPNTSPVGSFPSGISPAGCYDMAGNVWEYCEDDWHSSYNGAPFDGSAWIDTPRAADRVNRGGSWYYSGSNSRCAYRTQAGTGDDRGFRCARTP